MSDFLLELFSEEIPARMQAKARKDLEALFVAQLAEAGLKADSIRTYSTPRRLALIASGLPSQTEAVREETKGPPTAAPDQAVEGFLRKVGLTKDQLEVRDLKGRDTYFAVIDKPGRPTAEILGPAIANIVRDFPWPKSMRWGAASADSGSLRWVRPLHRIVAMLGEEIVPVEVEGVSCGAASLGHRFHHPGEITFGGAHDYVEKLRMAHVLVDHEERETIVRDGATTAAEDAGYALIEDEGLVIENAGLTEWPVPLLGQFDPDFLDVPEEVIQLTARTDQKYFVMRDDAGKLAPAFICTANIESSDPEAVVNGNQRVLAARLSDARFFWENDLKVSLESLGGKLGEIVFHEKLGTVADKVDRVAKLARWLAEEKIVAADPDQAERAARLAKNDLVTGMVGEFPELQGVIGGYLARAQGEDDAVADAVRDHYKPVGQGDEVPTASVTVAVSLADKLDSLGAFFGAGMPPSGSKDPFALRRSALGALLLMTTNGLRFDLRDLMEKSTMWLRHAGHDLNSFNDDMASFFADRLKVQQREAGVRHDLIDAVFALGGEDDLVRLLARVKALQGFVETEAGTNLLAATKRASNILKKEGIEGSGAIPGTLEQTGEEDPLALVGESQAFDAAVAQWDHDSLQGEEKALADALVTAGPMVQQSLEDEDFTRAMEALASLRGPIDAFFEGVVVNSDVAEERSRRLGMLARFRSLADSIADFSKIEG
ncbi:glycine--tRNA ligase subunit beta [Sphingomicrobium arenosum]|uniref:glycine--tRNA ligase subunit beta n=1 Tax=Sphingomicrobium arenosum TaxID=2233861 RepID=UPI0022408E18|nr:glycine--tRNA ligase subunit beta [Sphingomicrobium arenosum]